MVYGDYNRTVPVRVLYPYAVTLSTDNAQLNPVAGWFDETNDPSCRTYTMQSTRTRVVVGYDEQTFFDHRGCRCYLVHARSMAQLSHRGCRRESSGCGDWVDNPRHRNYLTHRSANLGCGCYSDRHADPHGGIGRGALQLTERKLQRLYRIATWYRAGYCHGDGTRA